MGSLCEFCRRLNCPRRRALSQGNVCSIADAMECWDAAANFAPVPIEPRPVEPDSPPVPSAVEVLPWNQPPLNEWAIVGMNHYHLGGERRLFVAMTRNGKCIQAEGGDEAAVFARLLDEARARLGGKAGT